jgi:hypothetical protein
LQSTNPTHPFSAWQAERRLFAGQKFSGVVVHRNFEYLLLSPADVPRFTQLSTHTLAQKQHVPFRAPFELLKSFVAAMYEDTVESMTEPERDSRAAPQRQLRVSGGLVTITHAPPDRIILSWTASPAADMVADSLVAVVAQADVSLATIKATTRPHSHGGGGHDDHAHHSHAAEGEDEPPVGDHERGAAHQVTAAEAARAVAWGLDEPWARVLLESATGPFVDAAAQAVYAAHTAPTAATEVGDGGSNAGCMPALPPLVFMHRDALVRVLREQYGHEAVSHCFSFAGGADADAEADADAVADAGTGGAGATSDASVVAAAAAAAGSSVVQEQCDTAMAVDSAADAASPAPAAGQCTGFRVSVDLGDGIGSGSVTCSLRSSADPDGVDGGDGGAAEETIAAVATQRGSAAADAPTWAVTASDDKLSAALQRTLAMVRALFLPLQPSANGLRSSGGAATPFVSGGASASGASL